MTMGLFYKKKGACCAGQDIYDAKMVADRIGIPHYVLNYENLFRQKVIDDFVDSYARGETPLPCVRCNQSVKFKDLLKGIHQVIALPDPLSKVLNEIKMVSFLIYIFLFSLGLILNLS